MKILVVSATKFEIDPLLQQMTSMRHLGGKLICCSYKNNEIDFLITGVGMISMAYYSGKTIDDSYDVAFNLGICGSFNRNPEIGAVVNVFEDCFSELGAEDGE